MYKIEENQYIPYKARLSPQGMPLAKTYYYVTNDKGKIVNKHTGKPYRGKQMRNFAFNEKESAENFIAFLAR